MNPEIYIYKIRIELEDHQYEALDRCDYDDVLYAEIIEPLNDFGCFDINWIIKPTLTFDMTIRDYNLNISRVTNHLRSKLGDTYK